MNLHEAAAGLLSYALQSGLLLVVGLFLPRLLRLRHPAILLAYWRVLLLVVLLLPLILSWSPRQTPLSIFEFEGLAVDAVVITTLPAAVPGLTWRMVLLPLAVVAVLALLRLALGLVHLRRCRRTAVPLGPTPPVEGIQRRLGLRVPFLVSDRLPAPITFGWRCPAVLVPPAFHELSAEEQEGVACHELLHVKRGDWPMTFLEELLRALLWFHPAVWVLLSRIALSREQVVDAVTVRMTGNRRQYLDALWQIVCNCRLQASVLAVPMVGRRHLVERVALLKKEISMSKARIVISVLVLAVAVMAAGALGASVFPSTSNVAVGSSAVSTTDEKPQKTSKEELTPIEGECDEITRPVVVEKVNPTYPEEARKAKIMGLVDLRTVITEDGLVEDIEVLESPNDLLSEAAVVAVKQWRFDPALCDGVPVGVWYEITIKFNLK